MPPTGALLLIAPIAVLILWTKKRLPSITPSLIYLFFFLIGLIHATIALRPPSDPLDIANRIATSREMSVVGTLARCPETNAERATILVDVDAIIDQNGRLETHGLALLTTPTLPKNLAPGDILIARGVIGPVSSYGTPGAFDHKQYLEYQGIRIKGWIKTPSLIKKIDRLAAPPLTQRIRFYPERLRFRISRMLSASLPVEAAAVYKAILLGDSSNLSAATEEAFKASGSIHLLSISGLHMALVALFATRIISWLIRRSEWALIHLPATKIAALISVLPLIAYALIAGANPPVIRSLIMITVFIVALLIDRQWSLPTNIAIAAFIILAAHPQQLFTASFQLTFGAVAAIALFAPLTASVIQRLPDAARELPIRVRVLRAILQWAIASLLISLAVGIGTAPILAYHFNRISLISPIATLLIEPILCLWSLIIGLTACLFAAFPPIAQALLTLGSPGISISIAIAELCSQISGSSLWTAPPSILAIIGWYGTTILLVSKSLRSRRVLALGLTACLGLLLVPILNPSVHADNKTKVTVLDVGQGSATVIEIPGSDPILIDGGRRQSRTGKEWDVGEGLIAPFLWHRGVKRLAMVICSHPDADHYNGIPFIMEQFNPKTLWINGYESEEAGYRQMLALATRLDIPIRIAGTGQELLHEGDVTLTVLGGGSTMVPAASANNQSLVIRLTHGDISFLLPSDIEKETERALATDTEIKSDVLVAPHHGSATSSSAAFVAAVTPKYVAISAGQNQRGYFPAPVVLTRYREANSTVLTTAEQGTIFFATDGKTISVETYRKQRPHLEGTEALP